MKSILFVDRDGTLIIEPPDFQIDSLEKLALVPHVVPSLLRLQSAGYELVMVTNQDGLGTDSFPEDTFHPAHQAMLNIFSSQGITFADVLICPHKPHDGCTCRKPQLGLVQGYLNGELDRERSYVIGDRDTDLTLAKNMGIQGLRISDTLGWREIANTILLQPRRAEVVRNTRETQVRVRVNLDGQGEAHVHTGIGFFDHMLEQLSKHSGIDMEVHTKGDLHIDEHHTVEDTALALGQALRNALGNKIGIGRYGFVLPMDEAQAHVALDLSGRAYSRFEGELHRPTVGTFPTELVPHFFRSLADALGATLHVRVEGENAHHMIEACFKGVARALAQAVRATGESTLPSTKGTL